MPICSEKSPPPFRQEQCCPKQKPPVVIWFTKQHCIKGEGEIVEKVKLSKKLLSMILDSKNQAFMFLGENLLGKTDSLLILYQMIVLCKCSVCCFILFRLWEMPYNSICISPGGGTPQQSI